MTKIKRLSISKLSPIADYFGKTRVVAIGDFFSQRVLKPFADYMFNQISKFDNDCTYNQVGAARKIKERIGKGEKC